MFLILIKEAFVSFKKLLAVLLLSIALPGYSATEYEIEISHDDELLIINGEKYEAKTYCFNMEEGDKVIFLKGSAFGACVSAEILNLRTKKVCKAWCE
tara:strand:+ start:1723 stop:2016 length:294 start_codon:yes stop_codon:yes gene_type:complete